MSKISTINLTEETEKFGKKKQAHEQKVKQGLITNAFNKLNKKTSITIKALATPDKNGISSVWANYTTDKSTIIGRVLQNFYTSTERLWFLNSLIITNDDLEANESFQKYTNALKDNGYVLKETNYSNKEKGFFPSTELKIAKKDFC